MIGDAYKTTKEGKKWIRWKKYVKNTK
jgi:hypothetical protein